MPHDDQPRTPIPLWFGLYGTLITTILFVGVYSEVARTSTRGWLASFSAALELSGILLLASPELRPYVGRTYVWLHSAGKRVVAAIAQQARRIVGRRRYVVGLADTGMTLSTSAGARIGRGFEEPPPDDAPTEEKVAYLLRQDQRFKDLFNVVESQARSQFEGLRRELERMAGDLSRQTAESIRELRDSELRMRLLGVMLLVAGVILSYATNLS